MVFASVRENWTTQSVLGWLILALASLTDATHCVRECDDDALAYLPRTAVSSKQRSTSSTTSDSGRPVKWTRVPPLGVLLGWGAHS